MDKGRVEVTEPAKNTKAVGIKRKSGGLKGKIKIIGDWSDGDAEIALLFESSELFPIIKK